MVNTEIRLILFFAAKDGEALYSQQKQDQELTVAQIMNSLFQNSDNICRLSLSKLPIFAAKDGEALYSQQKQDQELTMAQIRNSLLPNSDSN